MYQVGFEQLYLHSPKSATKRSSLPLMKNVSHQVYVVCINCCGIEKNNER